MLSQSDTACVYTAGCTDSGYTCNTSTGLCGAKTCSSESTCDTLMGQYSAHTNDLCTQTSSGITCPTNLNSINNGTVASPVSITNGCRYNLSCNNNYTLTPASPAYIQCTGDNCTQTYLNNQLSSYTCTQNTSGNTCPTPTVTVPGGAIENVLNNGNCIYRLYCGDTLKKARTWSQGEVTQNILDTYIQNNWMDVCETPATVTCPSAPSIDNGSIAKSGTTVPCSYTASCTTSGYECDTTTGLCGTKTCSSESECNTLIQQYTNSQHNICKQQASTFSCPDIPSNLHPDMTITRTIGTNTCSYQFSCTNNFLLKYGNSPVNNGSVTKTCTGGECTSAWLNNLLWTSDGTFYKCACPENIPDPSHGTLTLNYEYPAGTCMYKQTCDTGYTGDTFLTCSGNNCTSAYFTSLYSQYPCTENAQSCPAITSFNLQSHVQISDAGSNAPECYYGVQCDNPNLYDLYHGSQNTYGSEAEECNMNDNNCTDDLFSGYHCVFKCPNVNTLPQPSSATLTYSGKNGTQCTYNQICNSGYKVNGNSSIALTCDGDQCASSTYFTALFNQHQCTSACPDASEFSHADHIVISNNNITNPSQCYYNVTCDGNYDLYNGGNLVTVPVSYTPCNATNGGCSQTHFSTYYCQLKCPETIQNGVITADNIPSQSNESYCAYGLTCDATGNDPVGTPNPMMVPNNGSTADIQSAGETMLNNYNCM